MNKNFLKYSFSLLLFCVIFYWLHDYWLSNEKIDYLINLLVSITSISLAILVTYFFSKLFTEREDRIQRKATIDDYSKKLTAFRNIAHRIKNDNTFWKFSSNAKSNLDTKYTNMTVEQFRSVDYDEYSALTKELDGELAPQAYLALRGLENNEKSSYEFYKSFKLQNYSLDEIERFIEYCGFYWAYCEEYKQKLSYNEHDFYKNKVIEEFVKIKGRTISKENYFKEISDLFDEMQSETLPKLYFLTEENKRKLPIHFIWISLNLLVFVVIMICATLLYILPLCILFKSLIMIFLISLLIVNTIDLVIGIFLSIPEELNIKRFYKI